MLLQAKWSHDNVTKINLCFRNHIPSPIFSETKWPNRMQQMQHRIPKSSWNCEKWRTQWLHLNSISIRIHFIWFNVRMNRLLVVTSRLFIVRPGWLDSKPAARSHNMAFAFSHFWFRHQSRYGVCFGTSNIQQPIKRRHTFSCSHSNEKSLYRFTICNIFGFNFQHAECISHPKIAPKAWSSRSIVQYAYRAYRVPRRFSDWCPTLFLFNVHIAIKFYSTRRTLTSARQMKAVRSMPIDREILGRTNRIQRNTSTTTSSATEI